MATEMFNGVIVFMHRSGSRVGNWELYPQALEELGRVCRPGTARAVMLTHDTKVLSRVCS